MARAPPSTAEAWSSPPKALEVRYTVKTKVVMTALKAAEPQSQAAQARIRPLWETLAPGFQFRGGMRGLGGSG